jgi:hypothetical protein
VILVEGTLWPLVVVGVLPDSDATSEVVMTVDERRLWSTERLRLALVVPGSGAKARAAQAELFRWVRRHEGRLRRRVLRIAWIIEDDGLRSSAEAWLDLAGDRLFGADSNTFLALKPALQWLLAEAKGLDPVSAWHIDASRVSPLHAAETDTLQPLRMS